MLKYKNTPDDTGFIVESALVIERDRTSSERRVRQYLWFVWVSLVLAVACFGRYLWNTRFATTPIPGGSWFFAGVFACTIVAAVSCQRYLSHLSDVESLQWMDPALSSEVLRICAVHAAVDARRRAIVAVRPLTNGDVFALAEFARRLLPQLSALTGPARLDTDWQAVHSPDPVHTTSGRL